MNWFGRKRLTVQERQMRVNGALDILVRGAGGEVQRDLLDCASKIVTETLNDIELPISTRTEVANFVRNLALTCLDNGTGILVIANQTRVTKELEQLSRTQVNYAVYLVRSVMGDADLAAQFENVVAQKVKQSLNAEFKLKYKAEILTFAANICLSSFQKQVPQDLLKAALEVLVEAQRDPSLPEEWRKEIDRILAPVQIPVASQLDEVLRSTGPSRYSN